MDKKQIAMIKSAAGDLASLKVQHFTTFEP
jgi:hypothetical protein